MAKGKRKWTSERERERARERETTLELLNKNAGKILNLSLVIKPNLLCSVLHAVD